MDRLEAIPRIRHAMITALEDVGLSVDVDHVAIQAVPSQDLYEVSVVLRDAEHRELARQTCDQAAQRVKREVAANIKLMPFDIPPRA